MIHRADASGRLKQKRRTRERVIGRWNNGLDPDLDNLRYHVMEAPMTTVHDVAAMVVQRGPVTAMKLQKLCYYAQAWSLAWSRGPLFREPIEAWMNGPVIEELWREQEERPSPEAFGRAIAEACEILDVQRKGVAS